MPVHDWSRVDANIFHHFHQRWTVAICDSLNAGLLPPGFSALVEQHAAGLVPDVLAVQRRSRGLPADGPGGVLTVTPPKTRHTFRATKDVLAARANRVVVRHRLGEVVCIIELVSPGNKASTSALQSFVSKTVEFLVRGIYLLAIDLFPPGRRDPQGIHKAIWDEVEDSAFELPPDKPLTLAAYVAGDAAVGIETIAYVDPFAVGDVLKAMPAYLDRDAYVPVPLESTYQSAWANCPADMRELVETGRLADE